MNTDYWERKIGEKYIVTCFGEFPGDKATELVGRIDENGCLEIISFKVIGRAEDFDTTEKRENYKKSHEEEDKQSKLNKYQFLIGKYIHRAYTSFHKDTNISSVQEHNGEESIAYDCISVYFDGRGDDYNTNAHISLNEYGEIDSEDIQQYLITEEQFQEAFRNCFDLIKRKANL